MKKHLLLAIMAVLIFVLSFSLIPLSDALAKKEPIVVPITIRNQTGGRVILTLINENWGRQVFEYIPGIFEQMEFQGKYKFYASTPCGNRSGEFNLNSHKELFFSCGNGLDISLKVPVGPGVVTTPIVEPPTVVPPTEVPPTTQPLAEVGQVDHRGKVKITR